MLISDLVHKHLAVSTGNESYIYMLKINNCINSKCKLYNIYIYIQSKINDFMTISMFTKYYYLVMQL
jgi:hypothetical protein